MNFVQTLKIAILAENRHPWKPWCTSFLNKETNFIENQLWQPCYVQNLPLVLFSTTFQASKAK